MDFTGGIGEEIDLSDPDTDVGQVYNTLKRIFSMNSLICASIDVINLSILRFNIETRQCAQGHRTYEVGRFHRNNKF